MYDEILIATDGSEGAARAVEHGIALAKGYDARVHAVYALNLRLLSTDPEGFSEYAAVQKALRKRGERATEDVADRAEAAGVSVVTAVEEGGSPWRTLVEYADEAAVDLVAMGTHGRRGLSRLLLGSTAESVMRHAAPPVLAARTPETGAPEDVDYDEILVPTDGGPEAAAATDHALSMAERFDARVHALSVVDTSVSRSGPLVTALESVSREAIEAFSEQASGRGVERRTDVVEGEPADAIVEYANDHGIDLVAMGTHQRRGLDRFLTRSVSERVVRRADPPVLTVNPGGE